jgi:hypothetical protein
MRTLLVPLLGLALVACTHAYTPSEYPLAAERIPPVRASAPVAIVNVQHRVGDEILFAMGAHKWLGDHREITEHFAGQLAQALQQSGVQVVTGPAPKRLDVAVSSLAAWPAFYHTKAKAVISVTTGDGQRFDIVAGNGSPGNIYRTLNGTLAIAVLETMKHPGVQAYLTQPPLMLVPAPVQPASTEAPVPQAAEAQAAGAPNAAGNP